LHAITQREEVLMIKPLLGLLVMYVVHDLVSEHVGAKVATATPAAVVQDRCLAQCTERLDLQRRDGLKIHPGLAKILNVSRAEPGGVTLDVKSRDEADDEDCGSDDLTGSDAHSTVARADLLQYPERHSSGQAFTW
jgi:hypothetical protein